MAIIKLGATVVGIRGTIAGVTYSAGKSGPYARGWGRGANTKTAPQTTQRNRQSVYAASWRALTAAQRNAWDAFAALPAQAKTNSLGVSYNVSGFAWYVALNTNLNAAGDAAIVAAPVLAIPGAPTLLGVVVRSDATGGASTMTFNPANPDIGKRAPIFTQLRNSIGRQVGNPRDRIIIGTPTVGVNQVTFTNEIRTRYGIILIGQRCFFKTCFQNAEGRRSAFTSITTNII